MLVPAEVNEQTGYRSYTFDQIERAMLITVLRGTGMSVKLVRRALDEPDTANALLHTMTVVSKLVPGPAAGPDQYDWDQADAALRTTLQEAIKTVESCGAVVSGTPWRAPAIETQEQKRQNLTTEGPHWLVKIPITVDDKAALSGAIDVQTFEARTELSIFIPGKSSMAKYGTAISRLAAHPLDGAFIDLSRIRQVLHDDGVETTVAICKLDETG
ncbi:MerR family transcriptional regulator [Kibdelosporangium aridum]|uniref:MerR family transcriptional regulator n=1 Tax=Kibdelosporangium aridum TaxID=2030 RepID=UPI00068D349F|nr:MerR family transcriptional regulator [Kibdelosporangium aridum]